jgi:hypothetical protein
MPIRVFPQPAKGIPTRVLHVGDHDPSGVHIIRNLEEDVSAFCNASVSTTSRPVIFRRVAVLPEHVEAYRLQTSPAKSTDRRSFDGVGDDPAATVQAEALDPADIADLVEAAICETWNETVADKLARREKRERARLESWLEKAGQP